MRGRIPRVVFFMAVDAEELLDTIATNITNPQSVSVDGQSVTHFSPQDQLAVQKAVAGQRAAARGFGGVVRQRLRSPNALGSNSDD